MSDQRHFFIRHAHRPEFASGDLGNEVSINSEGRAAIKRLSQSMRAATSLTKIFTSPVKRCVETALELCEALQRRIPIIPSTLLGEPGFLISNPSQAWTAFHQYSTSEIVCLLVNGHPLPGFHPFERGCAQMLGALLSERGASCLSISHDLNIAVLGCWLFDTKNYQAMMPAFLEGIEFDFDGLNVNIHYRGFKIATDETSLRERIDSQLKPA